MIIKNKKFIFQIFISIILITTVLFLSIKINKSDLCISSIQYSYNLNYIENHFSKNLKFNLLNQIDKKNHEINHYFRFSHDIIATSSIDGECNENVKKILLNLKNTNELSNLIKEINYIKEIEIKKLLIFIFLILFFSIYLLFFVTLEFFRNEIKLTVNKNKN